MGNNHWRYVDTMDAAGLRELPSPTEEQLPDVSPSPPVVEKEEIIVTPAKLDGYLKDALPFSTEEVRKIWVKGTILPAERMYVILQNLNGLELTKAASDNKTLNVETLIRFETVHISSGSSFSY